MIGICINTVARRVVFNPESSIIDALHHIQADQLDITKYEYITLPEIQSQGVAVSGLFKTLPNIRNLTKGQEQVGGEETIRLLTLRDGGIDG